MLTNLKTLKKDFFAEKKSIILGSLALIVCDAQQLIVPIIVGHAADYLALGRITYARLLLYGAYIVLLACGVGVMRYFWRYFLIGTSFRIEEKLRNRLFGHLQKLSVNYYSAAKTGDIMAHATNDIGAVRSATGFGAVMLVDTLFLGIACPILMFTIDVKLTLCALLPLLVVSLIVGRFDKTLRGRFERVQEAISEITERARENFAGTRVVKAYAQEEPEKHKFQVASLDYLKKDMHFALTSSVFGPLISLCAGSSAAVVLLVGGRDVILAHLSIGSFVAFNLYLVMLTWPMMAIGFIVNNLQRGEVSMGRINKILSTEPEIRDRDDVIERKISGEIEFSNLTYQYPNASRPALLDVSLRIPAGRTVAIVGRIGSGKSTLVNLIPRLLEPSEGELLIDGVDVRKIALASLRSQVACVPQDTLLFSDSVRENIAFGRPETTGTEIERVAKIAQIHDQVMTFPENYSSMVGERGVMLSGGEKQRIAIARALLTNPTILILDDCFSSVDTDTEERILREFRTLLRERTSIIISHRISTISGADEIVVLDDGAIAERGSHAQLIERGGIYAQMYRRQQIEEEIEKDAFGKEV
jgi:ATP-binding cassette subfamily B protein